MCKVAFHNDVREKILLDASKIAKDSPIVDCDSCHACISSMISSNPGKSKSHPEAGSLVFGRYSAIILFNILAMRKHTSNAIDPDSSGVKSSIAMSTSLMMHGLELVTEFSRSRVQRHQNIRLSSLSTSLGRGRCRANDWA